MKLKTLTYALFFLLLSGCANVPSFLLDEEWQEAQRQEKEARRQEALKREYDECKHLGFTMKTETFGNCILQLRIIAAQQQSAIAQAVNAAAQRSNANANTMRWLQGK